MVGKTALLKYGDAIGIDKGIELIKQEQGKISDWLNDFVSSDFKGFYTVKEGKTWYYDIPSKSYKVKPGQESFIILDNIRKSNEVFKIQSSLRRFRRWYFKS